MAFEYLGTPIEEVQARKAQGSQNFPFQTPWHTLVKDGTQNFPNFSSYRSDFVQYIGGVDYDLSARGAKNGFYVDIVGCNSNTGVPFRFGLCAPHFNAGNDSYYGAFVLRVPIVQTRGGVQYVTYHFIVCMCASNVGTSAVIPPGMVDYKYAALGGESGNYQSRSIVDSTFRLIDFNNAGYISYDPNSAPYGLIRDTTIVGRLRTINNAIAGSEFNKVFALKFNAGSEPSWLRYYLLLSQDAFGADYANYMRNRDNTDYNNAAQTQDAMMATNLPIWDIGNGDFTGDILHYLRTGVATNTWDGYSKYEPDFDVTIEDTSTRWVVKVCGDPVDNVKIAWSNTEINAMPKASSRLWRCSVWVQGHFDGDTYVDLPTLDLYGYLYDGAYTYRKCVLSWSDIWSHCYSAGIFSSKNAKIRIAFCLYFGDQTSAPGYVDVDYDSMATPNYGFLELFDNSTITVGRYGNPDEPIDPDDDDDYDDEDDDDDDGIEPDGGISVTTGGFCRCYKFNTTQLTAVARYFWNDGADSFISKYINAVNDPVECILSCGYMPVNASGLDNTQVSIGNVAFTDCVGTLISHSTVKVLIGSLHISEIYNSFLDYQPYTNLTIFLPYIGFKTLPTNLFMGKTLKVYYSFDLVTGACKALLTVVSRDSGGNSYDKYVMSFDGDCMIHIPMTASNNADVLMQRLRSAVEAGTSIAAASVGSVSSSRTIGSVASTEVVKKKGSKGRLSTSKTSDFTRDTDLSTTRQAHNYGGMVQQVVGSGLDIAMAKHSFDSNGGASSAVCSTEPNKVYIIIDSPTVQYPSTYDHNCGKPCELSLNLSSISGYTECDPGIDLSGLSCTEEEKSIILRELTSGVYL